MKRYAFDKVYFVDTNVILDDHENIEKLSEDGVNLIVLCETVINEIDLKKSGNELINFHAREFNRKLIDSEIIAKLPEGILVKLRNTYIYMVKDIADDTIEVVNNDRKIIATAKALQNRSDLRELFDFNEFAIVSNDIAFRTYCLLQGLDNVEPFQTSIYNPERSFAEAFYVDDKVFPDKEFYKLMELEEFVEEKIDNSISHMEIIDNTGHPYYLIRESATDFRKLDNRQKEKIMSVTMRNMEQRIAFNLCTGNNDIVVIEGIAGTGKTLIAALAAIYLRDKNPSQYDKILYIRKTIISGDKQDEIGFLPGSQMKKIAGYLYPFKDNLEFIIKSKSRKKSWTSEEIEKAVQDLENKYEIDYLYTGHLRGRSISGVIILDEAQNFSIKDITTILSRVTEGSKVIILGSLKQIDNPYLNKYNNALTFMLNQCGTFNSVQVQGIRLVNVHRGKITEWIEKITK